MYLFPFFVIVRGPTISIPILWKGAFGSIGCNTLFALGFPLRWQALQVVRIPLYPRTFWANNTFLGLVGRFFQYHYGLLLVLHVECRAKVLSDTFEVLLLPLFVFFGRGLSPS